MGQVHAALSAGRRILTLAVACAACAVLWLLLSATSARADESGPTGSLLGGVTGALPAPVGDAARPVAGLVDPAVQGAADATRRTTEAVRTATDAVPAPAVHQVVHVTTDTTDRLVDRVAGVRSSVTDAVEQPPSLHSTAPARHTTDGAAATSTTRHADARPTRAQHRSGHAQGPVTTQAHSRAARVPGSGAAADLAVPTAKSAVRAGIALALGDLVPFGSSGLSRGTPDGRGGLVPTSPWLAALVAGLLLAVLLRVQQRRPARGWLLPGSPSYPPGCSPD
jgi:hypothetical protein